MIKVLIKINDEKEIIDITSSIFLKEYSDYIEIDSGNGDKYAHAQNMYLNKPLIDQHNRYNYKYLNETIEEVLHDEYVSAEIIDSTTILNSLLGVE